MKCWDEIRIEEAALRLVDAEEKGAGTPPDLVPFSEHAAACARCGRLLRALRETEIRFRARRAETVPGSGRGTRVFALVDAERSGPAPVDRREKPGLECFSYAASSSSSPRPTGPRIRQLRTEDGRREVRIVENESGGGATAVLLPGPEERTRSAGGVWKLRIPGGSFPFLAGGAALLPVFPERGDLQLILEGEEGEEEGER